MVDITGTLDRKIEALRQHRSQITDDRLRELVPRRAAEVGAPYGLEAAEAFHHIQLG
jgi:LmbE family N-acetylglucosaminyl deacetylase